MQMPTNPGTPFMPGLGHDIMMKTSPMYRNLVNRNRLIVGGVEVNPPPGDFAPAHVQSSFQKASQKRVEFKNGMLVFVKKKKGVFDL